MGTETEMNLIARAKAALTIPPRRNSARLIEQMIYVCAHFPELREAIGEMVRLGRATPASQLWMEGVNVYGMKQSASHGVALPAPEKKPEEKHDENGVARQRVRKAHGRNRRRK